MMNAINSDLLGSALIALGKRMRAGKCEMSQEQMDHLFDEIQKAIDVPISKEQACSMLGISRSTFDAKVRDGELPRGEHRRGFKEKIYYRNDIEAYGRQKDEK